MLKNQREDLSLSLREIADRTRIPLGYLESLEAGDHRSLPSPVFIKGFLRSYALEIGLNPADVIQQYKFHSPDHDEPVITPLLSRKGMDPGPSLKALWAIPLLLVVIALGAVIYFYLPQWTASTGGPKPSATPTARVDAPQPRSSDIAGTRSEIPGVEPRSTTESTEWPGDSGQPGLSAPEPISALPAPVAADEPTPAPALSPPESTVISEPVAPIAPTALGQPPARPAPVPETDESEAPLAKPPVAGHQLKLVFTDETWVQVIIDGQEPQHELFQPGMSKTWVADESFGVRVGNGGAVEVYFDGQDLGTPGQKGRVLSLSLPPNSN